MTDQSPASPSLRAAAGGTSAELTVDDARKLYEKFADKDGSDAIRVMAQIALWGKRQQVEAGRLRLLALRQLGRFLIRNGRGRGRPATPPSAAQIAEAAKGCPQFGQDAACAEISFQHAGHFIKGICASLYESHLYILGGRRFRFFQR
jgi:hypothetical protein